MPTSEVIPADEGHCDTNNFLEAKGSLCYRDFACLQPDCVLVLSNI